MAPRIALLRRPCTPLTRERRQGGVLRTASGHGGGNPAIQSASWRGWSVGGGVWALEWHFPVSHSRAPQAHWQLRRVNPSFGELAATGASHSVFCPPRPAPAVVGSGPLASLPGAAWNVCVCSFPCVRPSGSIFEAKGPEGGRGPGGDGMQWGARWSRMSCPSSPPAQPLSFLHSRPCHCHSVAVKIVMREPHAARGRFEGHTLHGIASVSVFGGDRTTTASPLPAQLRDVHVCRPQCQHSP